MVNHDNNPNAERYGESQGGVGGWRWEGGQSPKEDGGAGWQGCGRACPSPPHTLPPSLPYPPPTHSPCHADDGEFVIMRALRAIKQGEAVTNSYQSGVVHRADMSLYIYGFFTPSEQVGRGGGAACVCGGGGGARSTSDPHDPCRL